MPINAARLHGSARDGFRVAQPILPSGALDPAVRMSLQSHHKQNMGGRLKAATERHSRRPC